MCNWHYHANDLQKRVLIKYINQINAVQFLQQFAYTPASSSRSFRAKRQTVLNLPSWALGQAVKFHARVDKTDSKSLFAGSGGSVLVLME